MSLNDDSRPNTPLQPLLAPTTSVTQKADQIVHRFFIKFLLLVLGARATTIPDGPRSGKLDKWFNLETPDTDLYREEMRRYRSLSSPNSPQSLVLHVVLTIPELGSNRALVLHEPGEPRVRIEPSPRAVLLETWILSLAQASSSSQPSTPSSSTFMSEGVEVSLSAVYKHAISMVRSIYSLCRLLPASKLQTRYRMRPNTSKPTHGFGIEVRMDIDPSTVLVFDASPSPSQPTPVRTSTHTFPSLSTPIGGLRIAVRYLTSTSFKVDTVESLWSSQFFSQDAGEEAEESFVPTVITHRARDSASSPSSATMNTAAAIRGSRPGPVPATHGHSRTVSFPAVSAAVPLYRQPRTQQQHHHQAVSGSASGSDRSLTGLALNTNQLSGGGGGNSPRLTQIKAEATQSSLGRGTPPRIRGESLGMGNSGGGGNVDHERISPGTSTSPPSSGLQGQTTNNQPPVLRPAVGPIHPFKSSTLTPSSLNSPSTPSLRSTPSIGRQVSVGLTSTSSAASGSSKPWPTLGSSPPTAGVVLPSGSFAAPFALSTSAPRTSTTTPSPSTRHSFDTGGGAAATSGTTTATTTAKPAGKRYSSSFIHRFSQPSSTVPTAGSTPPNAVGSDASGSAGNSVGATGTAPVAERERRISSLDPTADEDELQAFLKEIDSAVPLRNLSRGSRRDSSGSESGGASSSFAAAAAGGGTGGSASPHIVTGFTSRRATIAERRRSPLVGQLELPPSPLIQTHTLPTAEEEEDDDDGNEEDDEGEGDGPSVQRDQPRPTEDTLQSMEERFQQSVRGVQERRRRRQRQRQQQQQRSEGESELTRNLRRFPISSGDTGHVRGHSTGGGGGFGTPGGGSVSDGSGYGVFGRLDLEGSERRPSRRPSGQEELEPQHRSRFSRPLEDQSLGRESPNVASGPRTTRSGTVIIPPRS